MDTVEVFLAMRTQWNKIAGMSGVFYDGMKYEVIRDTTEMMGIKVTEEMFYGLRVMEAAAQEILNSRH